MTFMHCAQDSWGNRRGFTLIELLVVVSVVAILAAMLIPALNLVRSNAKTIKCANAQRQVVLGCHTYAVEHDGGLPSTRVSNNYWFILIGDYLAEKSNTSAVNYAGSVIAGCPEFTYDPANWPAYSYGINTYLAYGDGGNSNNLHNRIGGNMGSTNFTEYNIATVTKQTTRVYFADTDAFWTGVAPPVGDLAVRHKAKIVVTYVDGHSGRTSLAEASSGILTP